MQGSSAETLISAKRFKITSQPRAGNESKLELNYTRKNRERAGKERNNSARLWLLGRPRRREREEGLKSFSISAQIVVRGQESRLRIPFKTETRTEGNGIKSLNEMKALIWNYQQCPIYCRLCPRCGP